MWSRYIIYTQNWIENQGGGAFGRSGYSGS